MIFFLWGFALPTNSIKNFTDESRLPPQDKKKLENGKIIVGTEVNEVQNTARHQGKDLDKKILANVQELDEKVSSTNFYFFMLTSYIERYNISNI